MFAPYVAPILLIALFPLAADEAKARAAIVKAIALLQKSGTEYLRHRECFSCHHQAVPLVAVTTAKARGLAVDEEALQKQVLHTAAFLTKNKDNYQKGRGQGGQVDTAGYALWALDVGGHKPDATTAAVAEYLLQRDKDQNHWRAVSNRPPSEKGPFTATYLALRGLHAYATAEQKDRVSARTEAARRWLRENQAKDTEDRVFRLRALQVAGAEAKEVQAAGQELRLTQRADGGWSQIDDLASDAYATGSALVALHQAGGLAVSDPVYQRGLKFLVATQRHDGSWLVASRSRPFQLYFESGFPHGKDQFISIAASAWATTALALAQSLPPTKEKERPQR